MQALFILFSNICRLKKGPDAVPASMNLFIVLFGANFIIESALGLTVYNIATSVLLSLLSVVFLFAFTYIWLLLFKLSYRYLQTITTLVGVSLFTNIVCFIPATLLLQFGLFSEASFTLFNLLLIFWVLTIYANIYRAALNISFFLGFALAITYFISFNSMAIKLIGV